MMALAAAAGRRPEEYTMSVRRFNEVRAGGWDPGPRVEDQDIDGVDAEVLFGAAVGAPLPSRDPDLQLKHEAMAGSLFAFLRATFYRWVSLWLEVCPDLAEAPRVLAVGDLHVENFGTWRDIEGRVVWGVNDVDEAARMPYALDLVRLVTSAILAKRENGLAIDASSAATAVLEDYSASLEAGGKPFILEESHPGLREMAMGAEREPTKFWSKLTKLPRATPPKDIQRLLQGSFPDEAQDIAFSHRIAGVGSLGRPRYVATAPVQRRLGRSRSESVVAVGLGVGQWTAEGTPPTLRSASQPFRWAAGSILCRRGRGGSFAA